MYLLLVLTISRHNEDMVHKIVFKNNKIVNVNYYVILLYV